MLTYPELWEQWWQPGQRAEPSDHVARLRERYDVTMPQLGPDLRAKPPRAAVTLDPEQRSCRFVVYGHSEDGTLITLQRVDELPEATVEEVTRAGATLLGDVNDQLRFDSWSIQPAGPVIVFSEPSRQETQELLSRLIELGFEEQPSRHPR